MNEEAAMASSESSPAGEFDNLFDEVMGLCAAPTPVVRLPAALLSAAVSVPAVSDGSATPGSSSEDSAVLDLVVEIQAVESKDEESIAATLAPQVAAPRIVLPKLDDGEFVEALPESLEEKEEVEPAQEPTGFFAGHRWGYRSYLVPDLADIQDVSEEEEKEEEEVAAREAELWAAAQEGEEEVDRKFVTNMAVASRLTLIR